MKKTFACGHKGKGKSCHRCRQADELTARRMQDAAFMVHFQRARNVEHALSILDKRIASLRATE